MVLFFQASRGVRSTTLIVAAAIALTALYNFAFYRNVLLDFPLEWENIGFLLSLPVLVGAITALLLALVCNRYTTKPLLMALFPAAALAAYFMDSYNVVIDSSMIRNAWETNFAESADLFSLRLLLYLVFLGLLPALGIYRLPLSQQPYRAAVMARLKLLLISVAVMLLAILSSSAHYASFFREHKVLRYYSNPVSTVYSVIAFLGKRGNDDPALPRSPIGLDATASVTDAKRELIIMVVGETARADRFSLNGYTRDTNPDLEKIPSLVSFRNMESCATSTAVSLPCLFALPGNGDIDADKFHHSENLLDVLKRAGVSVLWRDNNSDSKGVARDVPFEDFRDPALNPVCDSECRDVGMLAGLDEFIAGSSGDILVVLHQMGNHGPAYFKRYPPDFAKFFPNCESNQLEQCDGASISNSYDNAILYTDYFLSRVIAFLRAYDRRFETAMFYISDHGESLGEHGIYLHGLPNFIAPREQKQVASIIWFGRNSGIDFDKAAAHAGDALSHANVFHTLLGLFEVNTAIYRGDLDILRDARD